MSQIILMVGLLALMYFMMIRPQQQQQKKRKEMLENLKVGAEVVTIGGLHGTVSAIDENTVRIKVAAGVELTFNRGAVGSIREAK